jgi:transposase
MTSGLYRRGSRGRMSRFSDKDILQMRKLYLGGMKQKTIAAMYQCSIGTVADFINYGLKGRPRGTSEQTQG